MLNAAINLKSFQLFDNYTAQLNKVIKIRETNTAGLLDVQH